MNEQNRPLVTDDPVEFEKLTGCHSRLQEINQSFYRNPWNIPQITKETPKDHNMKPVGLGNTLGFGPIMPKKLPGHCIKRTWIFSTRNNTMYRLQVPG